MVRTHKSVMTGMFILAMGTILAVPSIVSADAVNDLFNTGVDASGNVLPLNTSPDPHYTIVNGVDGSVTSPTQVNPGSPFYIAASTTSTYIQAGPNTTLGAYDYETTFTLPAGATGLTISGFVAVDNTLLDVLINGISVGVYASGASLTNLTGGTSTAFTNLNPVSFTTPDANLLAGTNTLTWITGNQAGSATSFRAESLAGTFTARVPEPMSLSLLGLGAGSLILRRRRMA